MLLSDVIEALLGDVVVAVVIERSKKKNMS